MIYDIIIMQGYRMKWTIEITNRAEKTIRKLKKENHDVYSACMLLIEELKEDGPARPNWPDYTKEKGVKKGIDQRHCHLKKGHPTYVACWRVKKNTVTIEVYYVGTHEKAPY